MKSEQWTRPIYWSDSLAQEFTLNGGLRELDPNAPVCHLSCYEADAFARWAGARLPTEFEWEIASALAQEPGNFVESRQWHPVPAAYPSPTGRTNGLPMLQMFGDVWEWTQSAYSPYPGYRTAAGALGEYNGKFMVNQLVLRGGSCATPTQSHPPDLSEFLQSRGPLAVQRRSPRERSLTHANTTAPGGHACPQDRRLAGSGPFASRGRAPRPEGPAEAALARYISTTSGAPSFSTKFASFPSTT